MPRGGRERTLLAAIVCAYALLFGRAVSYDYVWDDVLEIQNAASLDGSLLDGLALTQTERTDATLTELVGVQLAYDSYRPLLFASYWLEVQLWGRSARAMHLANLVLGALAIVCVYALARRLASSVPALIATTLFALHPAQTEAVVYISGRGDLLAGLFALFAALCVLRALDDRTTRWGVASCIAFAASLFTKEACIGLPVAIGALLWAKRELRARWWIVAALVGVALTYLVVRGLVTVPTTSGALTAGLAAMPGVVVEYVRVVLLPFDLSTERLLEVPAVIGWVLLVSVALGGLAAQHVGRPFPRVVVAGSVWFVALLGPSAVAIGASTRVVADRYVYAPLFGLALALAAGVVSIARSRPALARPLAVVAVLWAVMLVGVALLQVPVWRNNHTLYAHAVSMSPNSSDAHYRLAFLAARVDDWENAIPLLERAVELDPRNVRALVNLGVGQLRTGRASDAETTLRKAVAANPAAFRAWFNLGVAQLEQGNRAGCATIARALEINPRYAAAAQTRQERCK